MGRNKNVLALVFVFIFIQQCSSGTTSVIFDYRPVQPSSISDGRFAVSSGKAVELILFGTRLTNSSIIAFTENPDTCSASEVDIIRGGSIVVSSTKSDSNFSSLFNERHNLQVAYATVPISVSVTKTYYFCLSEEGDPTMRHQGDSLWLSLVVEAPFLPLAARIALIVIFMFMSGLFSGLNLGLMALDPTTLKIVMESGSTRQKFYANLIYKIRRHGNYLLCTLLLGNVLMNSTLTILLDTVLPGGLYAIITSTLTIVMFGEILPQAICSRHGLLVGAWTLPITLIFLILTFPLSFPISLILDCILGKEIGAVYNREQLLKLLSVTKEHHDLENDEVDIIGGVLAYKKKTAQDVMTNINDVFCIGIDSVLDFKTMKLIYDSGYSRIPVYKENKENIVHMLYVRDLAFVDPDDKTSLTSHVQFYKHELLHFYEDTRLDEIFKRFLDGKCHLAVIQQIFLDEKGKEKINKAVGIVTLEDIVEEILQREIVDETDRFTDNRTFQPRLSTTIDVEEFMNNSSALSLQQKLAVFQFLTTELEPFHSQYVSEIELKKLLNLPSVVQILQSTDYETTKLYTVNTPVKFFCLIVEGCMEVKVGKDNLVFESHSFSHFGSQTLMNVLEEPPLSEYRPDFSAWPSTNCLVVIIAQQQYRAAHQASQSDRGRSGALSNPSITAEPQLVHSKDVFTVDWVTAETLDAQEDSRAKRKSGLASVTRYLSRKTGKNKTGNLKHGVLPYQNGYSDQHRLLSGDDDSSVDDEMEESNLHEHNGRAVEHEKWSSSVRTIIRN